MIDEDHECEWPEHGTWSTFSLKWTCPECGQKWEEVDDYDGVFWERV